MKLNWKQIALGVLTYFGLVICLIAVVVVGLFLREAIAGRSLEEMDENTAETTSMLILYIVVDLLTLPVGAYVAAARSNSRKSAVVHACVMAAISTAIINLMYLVYSEPSPLWYNVLSYGLILPAAFLGGLWRWRNLQRQHRELQAPQSPLPEVPRPL